ncbi:MAG: family 78 glycoside hydrolase catalytic domain [Fimbriimonas sp.]
MLALGLAVAMVGGSDPFAGVEWLMVPVANSARERAHWIWVQRPGETRPTVTGATGGTVRFERDWNLAERPKSAFVQFTADNEARVRVNGTLVGTSTRWDQLVRVDLAANLKAGENRIEVEAKNGPATGALNPAGFLLAAEATLDSGTVSLTSDEGWKSPDGTVVDLGPFDTAPWHLRKEDVPCPIFRREFPLRPGVKRAVARVIGLGHYDLYANGRRLGDGLLNGPWSQFDRTLYWQEFDVTKDLKAGANVLGVELGNGFYRVAQPPPGRYAKGDAMPDFSGNAPFLLGLALDVTYEDGRAERIATDRNWRWSTGPYALSHVFSGEDYDATRHDPAWQRAGYDANGWKAPVVTAAPKAERLPMSWPGFRAVQAWRPKEILNPKPGVWSYVFPQNAMAILRLKVTGKRGQRVKLRPSEVISPQGEVQQLNLWGGDASCTYTLAGGKPETREWRFFYHGFQFVEMTGAVPAGKPNPEGLPVVESLELVHVRTDNPQVGAFETSSDLYNRTHGLIDWAVRSNMSYVLSDCPHREKLGWQECAHLLFSTFAYRYEAQDWFRKLARDIRDVQLPDGRIPTVAPDYLMLPIENPFKFTIEWGASGVLLPWQAYGWYGDRRWLSENYPTMTGYVDWIADHAKDGLAPAGLGDWYDYGHGQGPGPSRYTPTELTATAMWALCADATAKAAQVLGHPLDAARYREMHKEIREAFLAKFYDPKTKTLRNNGSVQSGHAMALCADLIPKEDRPAVLDAIVRELEKRDYQQTPGDVGHLYFIRALAEAGRSDVLHRVYSRTGVGSYGGILAKGLTTLPETWDAITVGSNSLNHCMLGHAMEWFYGWVLGIRQEAGSVGWDRLLIAPEPGALTTAKGKTKTRHGVVAVEWRRTGHDFRLTVEVPKGSRATVALPVQAGSLTVDGKATPAKKGPFGRASVEVGPGKHTVRYDA